MKKVRLGRTEIEAAEIGFGALPIQRRSMGDAEKILKKAYESGVNFYDTAFNYTDSQEKIGHALSHVRSDIFIASKVSNASTGAEVTQTIEENLKQLNTDYVDVMQFHNVGFVPEPGGEDGMYDAMVEAKEQGKIRFIGLTNHKYGIAEEALLSGLYDTIQYPFSYLSSMNELKLMELAREKDVGLLAMKPLAGGVLNQANAVYYFFHQHDNCLPLYGIQHTHELDEFCAFAAQPPKRSDVIDQIERDKAELSENFCRGCGYCLPCPVDIEIYSVCRMTHFLLRSPLEMYLTEDWREKMEQTKECIECGDCATRCPYGLVPQNLFEEQYNDFIKQYNEFHSVR